MKSLCLSFVGKSLDGVPLLPVKAGCLQACFALLTTHTLSMSHCEGCLHWGMKKVFTEVWRMSSPRYEGCLHWSMKDVFTEVWRMSSLRCERCLHRGVKDVFTEMWRCLPMLQGNWFLTSNSRWDNVRRHLSPLTIYYLLKPGNSIVPSDYPRFDCDLLFWRKILRF